MAQKYKAFDITSRVGKFNESLLFKPQPQNIIVQGIDPQIISNGKVAKDLPQKYGNVEYVLLNLSLKNTGFYPLKVLRVP